MLYIAVGPKHQLEDRATGVASSSASSGRGLWLTSPAAGPASSVWGSSQDHRYGCKNRAEITRPLSSPLDAETSTVAKPACCLAQVDREMPRVEVGILDQAAADRASATSTAKRKPVAGLLGSVRQSPVLGSPPMPTLGRPPRRGADGGSSSLPAAWPPPAAAPERLSPHRRPPLAVG
jgi:hypothetical protein